MASLTSADLSGFLLGEKTPVQSSNIDWIKWNEGDEELFIGFTGGSICVYPGVGWNMAESFAKADSKGKWKDKHLVKAKWPFTYLVKAVGKRGK